jgi:hypothetical protein
MVAVDEGQVEQPRDLRPTAVLPEPIGPMRNTLELPIIAGLACRGWRQKQSGRPKAAALVS